jgi:tetratricopeptide (TPR) repeat protein
MPYMNAKLAIVRRIIFLCLFAMSLTPSQAVVSATLQGRLFLAEDQLDKPIEVVLRQGSKTVSRLVADDRNSYKFENLANGRYELVVKAGKENARQQVDLCCGLSSVSVVDINLDRSNPTITVNFPLESSAVVDVREIRRDYPKEILKEFEKARSNIRAGKLGKAADRLKQIVTSAPDFYSARAMLGMVYHTVGCYRDAEREYFQTSELSPGAFQPMINLGSLYIKAAGARLPDERKYLEEAIAILKKAIFINPKSPIAYGLLGFAYFKGESFDLAEEYLLKALENGNSLAAIRLMLVNVYTRQQRWKEALDQMDIYLRMYIFDKYRGEAQKARKEIAGHLKSEK